MSRNKTKEFVIGVLDTIDIHVGGDRPWDPKVHNDDFYSRVVSEGALGLGESYMDGWWDCDQINGFLYRLIRADLKKHLKLNWRMAGMLLSEKMFNMQSKGRRSEAVGLEHYDRGNDLFKTMLDDRMVYTCAYWEDSTTLYEAQENKLDLICRKIGLKEGMNVLDIGCGWGSFVKFASERYGVSAVGINNSREQLKLGRELCEGLPIELKFQDYREVEGTFDRIVSIGMFEQVGPTNFRTFMEIIDRCLVDDGLCLLHTVGAKFPNKKPDAWTEKYIFPGGILPTISQIAKSMEGLLMVEDWHNIAINYEKTLLAWESNFREGWPQLRDHYDERFYRMWRYYLLSMAGAFRARSNQVWQIVMAKDGLLGGYKAIR